MRWLLSLFHSSNRKLEVSVGGRWYLLFTILLGVVAIFSGNNVIYLLESLLLSALILSGVLSELTISRVSVKRELGQGEVGRACQDFLLVENHGILPLYCVEYMEWTKQGRDPLGFSLYLPSRSKQRVRSQQVFSERGKHGWQGMAIATSFPFGFARKVRLVSEPGSRIVWPARMESDSAALQKAIRPRPELEVSLGDLEEVSESDDISRVHWPSSARSGKLLARPMRRIDSDEEIIFHFGKPGKEMEKAITLVAGRLCRATQALLLYEGKEAKRITGALPALDALAVLPKEGST
ncbi:MAG: hypothetical protein ACXWQO_15360 [Bdellovibrionota bacterium]